MAHKTHNLQRNGIGVQINATNIGWRIVHVEETRIDSNQKG